MEDTGTLTQLASVLAAAFLGGAVLQKFKQPALVGYILVGILLGPSVLGLIHDKEQVDFFAELGVLLLLFVVGIELDLRRFSSVYKIALITTGLQIFCGLVSMAALGWLFDWPVPRIILLGFALSLSSTAVALKLLQDMKEVHTNLGRTCVGILIAQDIAVIPMLLIVGAMSEGHFDPLELLKIAGALGFMGLVIYIINKRPRFFMRWVEAIPTSDQTALEALALCFCAAAVAGMLGLSAGYGAFLAGLILGNTSKSHSFEEHTKPIFDVLMMVFFLSIGLLIDLSFIVEKFWRILALLAVTMVIKTFVNILVLRWLKVPRRNSYFIG